MRLDRRSFVRTTAAVGAVGSAATAGCLSALGDQPDGVVLSPPDNYDDLREMDVPYPIHGDDLPDATVSDPLRDEEVSTRGFVGERHVLMTFIFTDCTGACPALESSLLQVQADAAENGYGDEIALVAVTFDPEHDTAEVLREYGENRGVDYDADNWYFLRPENGEMAREVVEGEFGQHYSRNDPDAMMKYDHLPLILLANKDGRVERAYANEPPSPNVVIDDVREVVGGY